MGQWSRTRWWAALRRNAGALFTIAAFAALLPRCDTGAVGVDACRDIETARCYAVIGCPNSPVQDDEDAEYCELFYRDHCLHGIADAISPDQATVDACITAINLARGCWDVGLPLGECNASHQDAGTLGPAVVSGVDPAATGCDAIMLPQVLQACSFLEPPPPPVGGSGGAGGQGGAVGGGGSPG